MTWRERLLALWMAAKRWFGGHNERDRRIIVGVIAAGLLSIFYIVVFEPIRDHRVAVASDINDGVDRLERSQRLLGALDGLQTERDDLKSRLKAVRRRILPGGSGTLGAAAIQERANELAATHGVTIRTSQVMREEPADPYRKVSVRLTLAGELGAVTRMMAGLEYDHELTVPFMELSRRGAAARSKGPKNLSATLEIAGFITSDAGVAAEVQEASDELVGPPLPPEGNDFVGPQRSAAVPPHGEAV